MIPRINTEKGSSEIAKVQTPDYMWSGETWDLKGIDGNSKNTISRKFEEYKNQTDNIILYARATTLSEEEIIKYIEMSIKKYNKYYDSAIYITRNNKIIKFKN